MNTEIEALAAAGCRFVRLARREKRPLGAAWQTKSTDSLQAISQWLAAGHNLGLLLGPESGVVDVEFDDPAGVEQLAAFGISDMHTPTWRAARNSSGWASQTSRRVIAPRCRSRRTALRASA